MRVIGFTAYSRAVSCCDNNVRPCVAFRRTSDTFNYNAPSSFSSWHPKAVWRSRFDLLGRLAGASGGWEGKKLVKQEEKQQNSVKINPHQETWAVCRGRTVLSPEEFYPFQNTLNGLTLTSFRQCKVEARLGPWWVSSTWPKLFGLNLQTAGLITDTPVNVKQTVFVSKSNVRAITSLLS